MSLDDMLKEPGPSFTVTMPAWAVALIGMAILLFCVAAVAIVIAHLVRRRKR